MCTERAQVFNKLIVRYQIEAELWPVSYDDRRRVWVRLLQWYYRPRCAHLLRW